MSDNERITLYYFYDEIEGIETARFQERQELEMEREVIETEEDGGHSVSAHFCFRSKYFQDE
jgi:hypothetical protein